MEPQSRRVTEDAQRVLGVGNGVGRGWGRQEAGVGGVDWGMGESGGRISRRAMMRVSAGVLLAAGVWPGRAWGAEVKPLRFVVVNDLHYAEEACGPFFEGMVKEFNKIEDVGLVLVVGDLIDGGTSEQAHAIRDILKGLKAPYYVTPGNHDAATQTDRSGFDGVFGTRMNFTMEVGGWQFVAMDTSDGVKVNGFDCHRETLEFAAGLAGKLDRAKPTFVYTHFPLGPGVKNRLRNADALLEPLKPLNLQAIFTGHYHAFTETKVFEKTVVTTNRCCSRKRANHDQTWEKGFFVVDAAEGGHRRRFVEYGTNLPGSAHPATTRAAGTRGN